MFSNFFKKPKFKITILFLVMLSFYLLSVVAVLAGSGNSGLFANQQDIYKSTTTVATGVGYVPMSSLEGGSDSTSMLVEFLVLFLQAALAFLGTLFFVLMIYAGWLWLTAGGNEERVTKAKSILTQATIGVLIVFAAYAIIFVIINVTSGPFSANLSGKDSWYDWTNGL